MMPSDVKVNGCYLVAIVAIVTLAASGFGIALVTVGELNETYALRLDWNETQKEDNETYLTSASAAGLMIGSLLSSSIVKMGRRRAILLGSLIQLVGAAAQFFIHFWVLFAGKVVYGAASAIMLTGSALYLSETLPQDKINSHGFAVNLGVTVGISVVLLLGAFVSKDDKDSASWLMV